MASRLATYVRGVPLGLRYMVAAAFFFSLMSLLVKVVGQRLPSAEIVFARNVFSLVVTYGMLRRRAISPWGTRRGLLSLRGLAGFMALLCLFYALPRLPLADATVLHFTNPVFTTLLAALFLGESLARKDLAGTLLSLGGVVLVAQPSFLFGAQADGLNLTAVGAALAGAMLAATAYTLVRKLVATEHHLVIVFYFPLVSVPAAIPFMLGNALWPTPLEWLLLLGIGVFTQLGQIYLTQGLQQERAGRALSMSYIQILFAALWGFLFFAEVPDALGLAGAVLIIGGTFLIARRTKTKA